MAKRRTSSSASALALALACATLGIATLPASALAQVTPSASPAAADEGPPEAGARNITPQQMIQENTLGADASYQEPPKEIDGVTPNPDGKVTAQDAPVQNGPPPRIQIIMDSSGSMGQLLSEGKTKMYFAKKMLTRYFKDQWQEQSQTGLRVYGSRRKNACDDNFQAVKFGERSLYSIEEKVSKLFPVGRTPLNESVVNSIEDLKSYKGPKRIVIFTDGEETCGGDPCKTAEELNKQKQLDVKIFVVAIGFRPGSDALKKVSCLGDTSVANNEDELFSAMGNFSNKTTRPNLKVVSPLPTAQVFLYRLEGKKKTLAKVFTAAWGVTVPPGEYEAVVYLDPVFKFERFTIPPNKTITLLVDGNGQVTVNFFDKLLNVEVLDQNLKVVSSFKSDVPSAVPTGKWKLRIFKDPFYELMIPKFLVYPRGSHQFDVGSVGAVMVNSPEMEGVYVYDGKDKLLGNYLTNFPIVLKAGEYKLHLRPECSFEKVGVADSKIIKTLSCSDPSQGQGGTKQ